MCKYGQDSLEFNKSLLLNKNILIEWDSQIRDSHQNLLGYAYLPDKTFINQAVLENGHAKIFIVPPNLKYAGLLRKSELEARRKKLGRWKEEPNNPFLKSEYLGEKNTKIYYLPTSPELERIPEANLVKFRSRIEAKAAGYKACFSCSEDSLNPDTL